MGEMTTSGELSIDLARRILRGQRAGAHECLELARELVRQGSFSLARGVLNSAAKSSEVRSQNDLLSRIQMLRVLATYKDPELPQGRALEHAFSILSSIKPMNGCAGQQRFRSTISLCRRRYTNLRILLAFRKRDRSLGTHPRPGTS
jgi:hypothetical protein